jgi:glycosyltransferase A (GT-A) superfamily protein (DUF2064 family)
METLILMARSPATASTRLAPERGPAAATRLECGFFEDVARLCARFRAERAGADQNRRVVFCISGSTDDPIVRELAARAGARVEAAVGDTATQQVEHAVHAEFDRGARAVCVVGTAAPTVPAYLVDHAFRALLWERVVIGPTFDGGLWLLGLQRPAPDVFPPWAKAKAVPSFVAQLRQHGCVPHLLPFWYGVENEADLERLVWHVRTLREGAEEPLAVDGTWRALAEIGLVDSERSS